MVEIHGRYGSYRAAGIARARAEGSDISLAQSRRAAGGNTTPTALVGIPVLLALALIVTCWPAAVVYVVSRHTRRPDHGWTASLAMWTWALGLTALWLLMLAWGYWRWRTSALRTRRILLAQRRTAVTHIGEIMADVAHAFDWFEVVLRQDGHHEHLTVHRRDGTAEVIDPWPAELAEEVVRLGATYTPSTTRSLEIHALSDGEIIGNLHLAD